MPKLLARDYALLKSPVLFLDCGKKRNVKGKCKFRLKMGALCGPAVKKKVD